jgi:hypothetical protein
LTLRLLGVVTNICEEVAGNDDEGEVLFGLDLSEFAKEFDELTIDISSDSTTMLLVLYIHIRYVVCSHLGCHSVFYSVVSV